MRSVASHPPATATPMTCDGVCVGSSAGSTAPPRPPPAGRPPARCTRRGERPFHTGTRRHFQPPDDPEKHRHDGYPNPNPNGPSTLVLYTVLVQVLPLVRVHQCAPRGWHACPKSGGRGDHINEPIGRGERKGRRGTLPNPPLRLAAPPTTATNRRRVDHRFHLTPLGAHPTTHFGEMPRVRWTLSDACPTVSVTYRLQRRRCCCGGAGEPRGAAVAEHPQPQAVAARGRRDGRRANR